MVTKACETCGTSFEAARSSAKYCSGACRQRKSRAKGGPKVGASDLVGVVERTLTAAGRLETVAGQQALELARRMTQPNQSGASVASLNKQLTDVMGEISKTSTPVEDPIDELRRRREAKRNAG